jgi:hypothetical protein
MDLGPAYLGLSSISNPTNKHTCRARICSACQSFGLDTLDSQLTLGYGLVRVDSAKDESVTSYWCSEKTRSRILQRRFSHVGRFDWIRSLLGESIV